MAIEPVIIDDTPLIGSVLGEMVPLMSEDPCDPECCEPAPGDCFECQAAAGCLNVSVGNWPSGTIQCLCNGLPVPNIYHAVGSFEIPVLFPGTFLLNLGELGDNTNPGQLFLEDQQPCGVSRRVFIMQVSGSADCLNGVLTFNAGFNLQAFILIDGQWSFNGTFGGITFPPTSLNVPPANCNSSAQVTYHEQLANCGPGQILESDVTVTYSLSDNCAAPPPPPPPPQPGQLLDFELVGANIQTDQCTACPSLNNTFLSLGIPLASAEPNQSLSIMIDAPQGCGQGRYFRWVIEIRQSQPIRVELRTANVFTVGESEWTVAVFESFTNSTNFLFGSQATLPLQLVYFDPNSNCDFVNASVTLTSYRR